MKILACKDLGTPECPFVAKAETDDEAVKIMIEHAKKAHADKVAGMSDDAMKTMMAPKVKNM
jgi:predicted small metal-binding protein